MMPFIDLGTAPPSNAYLTRSQLSAPEKWYPLRVLVCRSCWLVQTEDYAHHEDLFADDYAYFSSFSQSWLDHARSYAEMTSIRFELTERSQVVEVASNDGYLLQYFNRLGVPCLGVEPTASTAAAAREKGIEVVERFFGVELADELVTCGRSADLTAANNVLAHVPDINDFVAGFSKLLKPGGASTFEFPHLVRMVDNCQFDTIYHEHFSYLSFTAVNTIFQRNGLMVFDVEELPTHGGSLRVYAQRLDTALRTPTAAVQEMLQLETTLGVCSAQYYEQFQPRANVIKDAFVEFLLTAKKNGKRTGAYGAAAKGNTLLNYAGIRPDLLPWVADRNPAKQGKYLPGCRIPIFDEQTIKEERPDYVVILPWNLRNEIMGQLAYIREWGGKFVTAVPELVIS